MHRASWWNIYRPWLDDWISRSEWLISELNWAKDILHSLDATTETCINPIPFLNNQAEGGIDLDGMGKVVDIVGASYHPAWNFRYANRELFPALMATGLRKQAAHSFVKRVEVTEVQTGNTFNSAFKPCEASASEIGQFFIACIAAGAESVCGWCLNIRSQDFEAGDWGLLDDNDNPTPRSKMLALVNERLQYALNITGEWSSYKSKSFIAYDPSSQAIEWVEGKDLPQVPGRAMRFP
ncbi:hypothetical protein [Clostridium lacusfryxellense]|uniref:hypothetical protein n=1 Tax=Clostridium lacusfryxellense TaxID=205328 RepID=UPI001C0D7A63|nr:hypothetical protein [Clostridium lacusfryxellense]MBU3113269.1 hypothetical protein [Clostridium lacusfryxellense]